MSFRQNLLLVVFVVLSGVFYEHDVTVKADLSLNGVKCGQKKCDRDDYCNPYHNNCEPCSKICDRSSHDYDEPLCAKNCQDYIHDSRFVLKEDSSSNANLRATVQRLSHLVTVVLTLVCFMLAVLAAVLFIQLYRWKKKKNITLKSLKRVFSRKSDAGHEKHMGTTIANPGALGVSHVVEKPDLRLEIPSPTSPSDHSPVTMTTSISCRRPAEDNTLDYAAYDNPAMSSGKNGSTTTTNTTERF